MSDPLADPLIHATASLGAFALSLSDGDTGTAWRMLLVTAVSMAMYDAQTRAAFLAVVVETWDQMAPNSRAALAAMKADRS